MTAGIFIQEHDKNKIVFYVVKNHVFVGFVFVCFVYC